MSAEDFDSDLKDLDATLASIEKVLDPSAMRAELAELGEEVASPTLWDDQANAQRVTGRISRLQSELDRLTGLRSRVDDLAVLVELARAEDDVDALASEIDDATTRRRITDTASTVRAAAVELAGDLATSLAADAADRIITDHLRPAFDDVLEQARAAAAKLGSHGLNPRALLSAPKAARDSFHDLERLADRHRAIQTARIKANSIGLRQPEHDVEYIFSTFRRPMEFAPGWVANTARLPRPPYPDDPTESIYWLVTDEQAIAAGPWLPTTAEHDSVWWSVFGEGVETRAALAGAARSWAHLDRPGQG